jgi:hypothetical protein
VTLFPFYQLGFSILANHMETQSDFRLRRFRNGVFICADPSGAWCYVKVPSITGPIEVQVFSSSGLQEAERLGTVVNRIVNQCQFRVNQELLLKSLHGTRIANDLLFLGKSSDEECMSREVCLNSGGFPFPACHFRCPTVFETSFLLNHRCPVSQVIMSLESTILSNFGVSNRPGIFVYKDEYDRIFYLELTPKKNDSSALTLLVHGIHSAGPGTSPSH